jgi:hypothetical protein
MPTRLQQSPRARLREAEVLRPRFESGRGATSPSKPQAQLGQVPRASSRGQPRLARSVVPARLTTKQGSGRG